jgi:hypothetical protein
MCCGPCGLLSFFPPFPISCKAMPFSDSSDLSDIGAFYDELDAGSEYEDKPAAKSSSRKQANADEYRLQKSLKPPRATTYTARALYGTSVRATLLLDLIQPVRPNPQFRH